jgi:hypothetical protein
MAFDAIAAVVSAIGVGVAAKGAKDAKKQGQAALAQQKQAEVAAAATKTQPGVLPGAPLPRTPASVASGSSDVPTGTLAGSLLGGFDDGTLGKATLLGG